MLGTTELQYNVLVKPEAEYRAESGNANGGIFRGLSWGKA